MQSDIPPLPISCLTDHAQSFGKIKTTKSKLKSKESKNNLSFEKHLHNSLNSTKKLLTGAIVSSPYKNSARFNPPDTAKSSNKSIVSQRISSAKMLRIKQLQNQLTDAHFHLNELSNENKLLKAIQKRQDTALKRYEGTNAELPRIINSHHEDLRVLQNKYKKLKSQYKETSDSLKEKESELHVLQVQNKKLVQLSRDRQLGEREKLQIEVSDLKHRINQQDEIIQTLKRKLALETKYLKHQLNVEITKHKETQKDLLKTQCKLKSLEELTELSQKRSYHAHQLAFSNKDKTSVTSQSLTNLSENGSENSLQEYSFGSKYQSGTATDQYLPALSGLKSTKKLPLQENFKKLSQKSLNSTEALMKHEPIRQIRFQNSPALCRTSRQSSSSRDSVRDLPIKESPFKSTSETTSNQIEPHMKIEKTCELPNMLETELNYPIDEKRNKGDDEKMSDSQKFISRSRQLHARLINSASEGVRPENTHFTSIRSRSLTKENLESVENNNRDNDSKYDRDSVVTVISKNTLKENVHINTNSDVESEVELEIDFKVDEDENILQRKSDIIIEDLEMDDSLDLSHLENFNDLTSKKLDADIKLNNSVDKNTYKLMNGVSSHQKLRVEDIGKPTTNHSSQNIFNFEESSVNVPFEYNFNMKENKFNTEELIDNSKKQNKDIKENNEAADDSKKELQEFEDLELRLKTLEASNNLTNDYSVLKINETNEERKNTKESPRMFDKEKLLAAMKAIDDNDNVEFVDHKMRRNSDSSRYQITENLYRGLPTHPNKKKTLMKELFVDSKLDNNNSSSNY